MKGWNVSDATELVERWLPVPGYEGAYEVSDLGRVRSVDREILARDGRRWKQRGKVLTPSPDGQGYVLVGLCREGQPALFRVHQLVAAAFHGPCPDGKEVCHGPNGKADNRPGNLRWGTRQENMLDKRRDGTHHMAIRPACQFGHLLQAPNLVAYFARRGLRNCLACDRGRSTVRNARVRHGIHLDLQTEADRHYRAITQS